MDRFRSCHSTVANRDELASYGSGRVVSIPSVVVVLLESGSLISVVVLFPSLVGV